MLAVDNPKRQAEATGVGVSGRAACRLSKTRTEGKVGRLGGKGVAEGDPPFPSGRSAGTALARSAAAENVEFLAETTVSVEVPTQPSAPSLRGPGPPRH